ncbi:MAG TPA: helix-turn-helix transcriptional regulator [Terriglobia bacterium]|nr:helix-turn-helix transcriptional regulator [Terriglobia bacterium]
MANGRKPVDVGKKIRSLREAKGLSQGDIERRSGLLRSYISRVEGGYTAPSLTTLDKFAKALDVEPYQLLLNHGGKGRPVAMPLRPKISQSATRLLRTYESLSPSNRRLLVSIASQLGKK